MCICVSGVLYFLLPPVDGTHTFCCVISPSVRNLNFSPRMTTDAKGWQIWVNLFSNWIFSSFEGFIKHKQPPEVKQHIL